MTKRQLTAAFEVADEARKDSTDEKELKKVVRKATNGLFGWTGPAVPQCMAKFMAYIQEPPNDKWFGECGCGCEAGAVKRRRDRALICAFAPTHCRGGAQG